MLPSTIIGDPELRLFKAICDEFDASGFMPSPDCLAEQIGVSRPACRLSMRVLLDAHWVVQLPDGGIAPARTTEPSVGSLKPLSSRHTTTLGTKLPTDAAHHSPLANWTEPLPAMPASPIW